jgi:hypothetical protein
MGKIKNIVENVVEMHSASTIIIKPCAESVVEVNYASTI